MGEFTPIETQEAFDAAIKDRLNRQSEKHNAEIAALKEQYADYEALKANSSELSAKVEELSKKGTEDAEKYNGYDSKIADYEAKIKQYETDSVKTKVAAEMGLTYGAIEFLKGETEEEIRASAEKLKQIAPATVAPLGATETKPAEDGVLAAFKQMNPNIKF